MNQFSEINSGSETSVGEYMVCCEHRFLSEYANKLADVLTEADWSPVLRLSQMLMSLRDKGGRVYLCGNGGSAANAVHLANDLVYAVAEKTGAGIDAVALSSNTAVITCLGNDVGYENIYSEQLAVAGKEDDILIIENFNKNKFSEVLKKSNRIKLYKVALDALLYIHKKKIDKKLVHYSKKIFFDESNLFFD